ncbi:MAG: MBL fold metallo-hydrolase [Flavobacteriales bacterium]
MIQVKKFTFNPFMENTFILWDDTKECIIIDPGCFDDNEKNEISSYIKNNELKPVRLLNTHCHLDHVLGNKFIAQKYDLELELNEKEYPLLQQVPQQAQMFGVSGVEEFTEAKPSLKEGEMLKFGDSQLEMLFVPGHSPGHIVLYSKEQGFIIGGDVLFQGGIGRTDLPGGNHDQLIKNIKEKIFPLGDDIIGPETNIGFEKGNNPFLSC